MNLQFYLIREQIIKSVREFFQKQNFHEVIVPVLNNAIPLEPNVYPMKTFWHSIKGTKTYYLPASPESAIKKMIAKGIGNCFAIGNSFRDLEDSGSLHTPEFLMLEWYRENSSCEEIMTDVRQLVLNLSKKIKSLKRISDKWQVYSMKELFSKYARLDLEEIIDDKKMQKAAKQKGYSIKNASWEQLFNQIFLNEIETKIGSVPLFITDFPSRISPLCAVKKEDPDFSRRFEFYLSGIEIGNGNEENTDSKKVRENFLTEKRNREKIKKETLPIDEKFLEVLDFMKNKKYAGIGLGIDRLTMVLAGEKDIRDLVID